VCVYYIMVKGSLKKSKVSFRRKLKKRTVLCKKRTTRRGATRRSATRRSATRRSATRRRATRRRATRRGSTQRGGALEPFTEDDLGEYRPDEYIPAEPEQHDDDEGYVADENEPTVEYKGVEYPIYININDDEQYIHLTDAAGNDYMVKVSAVYREK
jgi:hypothetical protein